MLTDERFESDSHTHTHTHTHTGNSGSAADTQRARAHIPPSLPMNLNAALYGITSNNAGPATTPATTCPSSGDACKNLRRYTSAPVCPPAIARGDLEPCKHLFHRPHKAEKRSHHKFMLHLERGAWRFGTSHDGRPEMQSRKTERVATVRAAGPTKGGRYHTHRPRTQHRWQGVVQGVDQRAYIASIHGLHPNHTLERAQLRAYVPDSEVTPAPNCILADARRNQRWPNASTTVP